MVVGNGLGKSGQRKRCRKKIYRHEGKWVDAARKSFGTKARFSKGGDAARKSIGTNLDAKNAISAISGQSETPLKKRKINNSVVSWED